ncbi:MAG: hypothetical protein JW940_21995 [Polyangiaceae bacterium]|nr:hypothetical protein [Polyangiaceae bacterium]
MNAPQGHVFELGLTADLDGDSVPDAVAWSVPRDASDASSQTGELWFYPGRGRTSRKVAMLPGFVPAGPGCQLHTELVRTGPKTVTLDNRATCQASLVPRAPTRGVQVVAPERAEPRVFGLRLADPAPGETLDVRADTSDRDGDGRDDIALRVSGGTAGSKQPASAQLVWLDRAAGPSREQDEPARSLARAASLELVRANGKNTSLGVPAKVSDLRRLTASLCAEGGTPRIWDWDAAPFRCPGLQPTLDRLTQAEIQSALVRKDTIEALASLGRDGWYFGRLSPKQRASAEGLVRAASVARQVVGVVTVSEVPATTPTSPHWSPLTFGEDGTLYLQQAGGAVRALGPNGQALPPARGDAGEAQPEQRAAWPLDARSNDGRRLSNVVYSCDRSEVVLSVALPTSAVQAVPTPVLSPRPGACGRSVSPPSPPMQTIGWSPAGPVAFVGGSIVGPGSIDEVRRTPPAGSPLSPDGKWLVQPAALGVLVAGSERVELWTLSGLDTLRALSDCVVANAAARVACIRAGRAILLTPESARP